MACFGCSATFHTSTVHSEQVAKKYNKIDYLGIGRGDPILSPSVGH